MAGEWVEPPLSRRALLRAGVSAAAGGLILGRWPVATAAETDPLHAGRPLVSFPEKTDLILLATRPPQLETPMAYFDRAITPNEAFFVRYHVFPIPTSIDLDRWRLEIKGADQRRERQGHHGVSRHALRAGVVIPEDGEMASVARAYPRRSTAKGPQKLIWCA